MKFGRLLFLAILFATPMAMAGAPTKSLRPVARISNEPGQRLSLVPVFYNATTRPVPRPASIAGTMPEADTVSITVAAAAVAAAVADPQPSQSKPAEVATEIASKTTVSLVTSRAAVSHSLRPLLRPANLPRRQVETARKVQTASLAPAKVPPSIPTSKNGSICGDRKIRGHTMSAIPGKLKGCGVQNPVSVTAVAGVALSKPVTMDCTTAKALNTWVEKGAKPSVGRLGGGIAKINMIAGYSCRTRNNKRGAKISEHGKGKAVDISGITLANGVFVSVLKGWNSQAQGKILRSMHKSACGPFGTVLGPSANRYHRDHFHFDTASYRSGSYCK